MERGAGEGRGEQCARRVRCCGAQARRFGEEGGGPRMGGQGDAWRSAHMREPMYEAPTFSRVN